MEEAGGEPVLVEDFPSLSASPRNACLDAVESCDIYLGIVGERGGWEAPSSKLVVEEEYDYARELHLPVLVFLERTDRDEEAERLAQKMSDFVDGRFRVEFDDPGKLRQKVVSALSPVVETHSELPMSPATIEQSFEDPAPFTNDAAARFVIAPQREGEVVDPITLESDEFRQMVFELGHRGEVGLFSYERPKEPTIEGDSLVIVQRTGGRNRQDGDVRLELHESGNIVIDMNLSLRNRQRDRSRLSGIAVSLEDVRSVLQPCFAHIATFYEEQDPYGRYREFLYNVGLVNLRNRTVVDELPEDSSSFTIPAFGQHDDPMLAYSDPRPISLDGCRNPEEEIDRAVTKLRRRRQQ